MKQSAGRRRLEWAKKDEMGKIGTTWLERKALRTLAQAAGKCPECRGASVVRGVACIVYQHRSMGRELLHILILAVGDEMLGGHRTGEQKPLGQGTAQFM